MTQRDTVTVAVLFMKPAFVTTPRNDMGGMLSKAQRSDGWSCVPVARFAAPHMQRMTDYHFWVYLSLLLIDDSESPEGCLERYATSTALSLLYWATKGIFDRNTTNITLRSAYDRRPTVGYPPWARGTTLTQRHGVGRYYGTLSSTPLHRS